MIKTDQAWGTSKHRTFRPCSSGVIGIIASGFTVRHRELKCPVLDLEVDPTMGKLRLRIGFWPVSEQAELLEIPYAGFS
jgi:hypothetical protein